MPTPLTLILHGGGTRSLIVTAAAMARRDRAVLLHVREPIPAATPRLAAARKQAEHFKLKLLVAEAPAVKDTPAADLPALRHARLLLCGLAHALELGAARLTWPAQVNGDFEAVAQTTERTLLIQQVAQLESPRLPEIATPMLELTDKQLIELGAHLSVPWRMAWSCQATGGPCHACPGCKRRHAAFEAAGIDDPSEIAGSVR
ncbi:MAG: 7-cyano-7-deazaguanine synthase [Phycisphaeraceae bacterium]